LGEYYSSAAAAEEVSTKLHSPAAAAAVVQVQQHMWTIFDLPRQQQHYYRHGTHLSQRNLVEQSRDNQP